MNDYAHINYKEGIENGIPGVTMDALKRYIEQKTPTGGFLASLLSNKLFESMTRADTGNLAAIKEIVCWVYMHAPSDCWGSEEKVTKWMSHDNSEEVVNCPHCLVAQAMNGEKTCERCAL